MKGLEICRKSLVDLEVRAFAQKAPFSLELMNLWNDRKLRGVIYLLKDKTGAFAILFLEKKDMHASTIRGLFVQEDHRRQGYGEYLIRLATHEHGDRGVIVNITQGAEKVYQKQGFEILGLRPELLQSLAVWGTISDEDLEDCKKKISK